MGGAVYFSWPQPDGGQSWQLLGTLSNIKPSAIFRISRLKSSDENINLTNSFGAMMQNRTNAIVGISVEPLVNIEGQIDALGIENFRPVGNWPATDPGDFRPIAWLKTDNSHV